MKSNKEDLVTELQDWVKMKVENKWSKPVIKPKCCDLLFLFFALQAQQSDAHFYPKPDVHRKKKEKKSGNLKKKVKQSKKKSKKRTEVS